MERFTGMRSGRRWVSLAVAVLALAACTGLTGCQFFFQCSKASCTDTTSSSSSTPTNTGDYAYVTNSTSGTGYLAGYEISTGTPIPLAGSPYSLGFEPTAMAIAPNNTLMFLGSTTNSSIYAYTIAANGVLSINNSGSAVATDLPSAMEVSPDGNYLYVLNANILVVTVNIYTITSSTGALTLKNSETSSLTGGTAAAMKLAPSADFLVVSLGSAGDEVFPLTNDLVSLTANPTILQFSTTGVGDYAVTVDANNNVYFARTGVVAAYAATANGVLTLITNASGNSSTGAADHSIALSKTGAYLYTGNVTPSTISGFSNSSGVLGVLSGSPYTAPSSVAAVAADNTGKYVIAAGYNSSGSGVVEYTVGSTGSLAVANSSNSTGANGITLLAVTH